MKIRNKIFLAFMVVSIFGGILIFLLIQYFSKNIMIKTVGSYNVFLAQVNVDSVDRLIDRRIENWELSLKNDIELSNYLKSSNAVFSTMKDRDNFLNKNEEKIVAMRADEADSLVLSLINNLVSENIRNNLEFFNKKYNYEIFPELFITNKYGAVVAQNHKISGYNQSKDVWWNEARDKGIFVENMSLDISSGHNALAICIRIDDENGNFLGVARVIYNIQDIFALINDIVKNSQGENDLFIKRNTTKVFLLDSNNKLLYGTGVGSDYNAFIQYINLDSTVSNFGVFKDSGIEKMFSFAKSGGYKNFKGLGWKLVIDKETNEVLYPLRSQMNYVLIGILISFFLTILVLFSMLKIILKSINKLLIGIKKIEDGDFSAKIDVVTKDEIGALSHSFNTMVDSIAQSRSQIEKKVLEQTKEIGEKSKDLEDQKNAILNILEDVEKEKDNAEILANDLEKFKLAVDDASDQVVITDKEGIVVYGNKAVKKITGFSQEEALGKKAGALWKMPMPQEYYEKLWYTIKNKKEVFISEIQNRRKNGELYIANLSISPVLNDDNEVIYFVAIEHDITKEKEVDKAKSEFVSLASHQLRTPLSAINWYTEMLLAGDAGAINEEQRKYLNEVAVGNRRMVELVDALLNVSRLDLGTFMIDPEQIDVVEIARSVITELKPQIIAKNLKIEEVYDENIKEFQADKKLLRIILQNLLSNSVKYTQTKGFIKVNILRLKKDDIFGDIKISEDSLCFIISDSGIGIPLFQQEKVFSKLFRADNARESETEGTGLGLYIIKSIVDQSGGMINFKSEENKGTTFYLSFPVLGMIKKEGVKNLD